MSSKIVFGTASSNVVLGTSPGSSTVAYASMDSLPSHANKTGAVYQAQSKPNLSLEEGKGDAAQILARADSLLKKGNEAYEKKNYHTSYLHYLQAKRLYEQLPQDAATLKKLIQVNYDLAWAASKIREDRREIAHNLGFWSGCMVFVIGCCVAPYYGYQLKSSHWVDNEKFRSYIDDGMKMLDDYIQGIHKNHKISMGTDKNTVQDAVRQDLGWAYSFKATFYEIQDVVSDKTLCNCCFDGTDGTRDVSIRDNSLALTNLKLAKEWDPFNQQYEANYKKIDAYMKTPIVNVNVYHS